MQRFQHAGRLGRHHPDEVVQPGLSRDEFGHGLSGERAHRLGGCLARFIRSVAGDTQLQARDGDQIHLQRIAHRDAFCAQFGGGRVAAPAPAGAEILEQ